MGKLVWILAVVWAYAWQQGFVLAHSGGTVVKPKADAAGKPNCSTILYAKFKRGDPPTNEVALFVGVLPVLSILGILAGMLSLLLLLRADMQVPATKYLIGVTLGDIILAVSGILHFVARLLDWDMTCRGLAEAYTLKTTAYLAVIGGRVITLFISLLGVERVIHLMVPSLAPRLPPARYPLVILIAGTAICILFSSPLFELCVGHITPYHTNATSYILLAPSFGGDRPASAVHLLGISIVHHVLIILNIIFSIVCIVKVIGRQRVNEEDNNRDIVVSNTYIAVAITFVICMLPSVVCSLLAYSSGSFTFKGTRSADFLTFLMAHYMTEMCVPLLHLASLLALHTYFRENLAVILGCIKPEQARHLLHKSEEF